ncbi:MAG: hypothetical protein GY757_11325 [bacterium]|nr:hypothetical protein [bacterium]
MFRREFAKTEFFGADGIRNTGHTGSDQGVAHQGVCRAAGYCGQCNARADFNHADHRTGDVFQYEFPGGIDIYLQDEATSVIWGMPGEVFNQGLADEVLPLEELGDRISRIVLKQRL